MSLLSRCMFATTRRVLEPRDWSKSCELMGGRWKLNPHPLEEQQVPLPAEPSLCPHLNAESRLALNSLRDWQCPSTPEHTANSPVPGLHHHAGLMQCWTWKPVSSPWVEVSIVFVVLASRCRCCSCHVRAGVLRWLDSRGHSGSFQSMDICGAHCSTSLPPSTLLLATQITPASLR